MTQIPSDREPVVYEGMEMRTIFLPGFALDEQLKEMENENLGVYVQAIVKIISHGGAMGSYGLYWTDGQHLHLEDGTVVARSLAEAARIAKYLNWGSKGWIEWPKLGDVPQSIRRASEQLGYLQ